MLDWEQPLSSLREEAPVSAATHACGGASELVYDSSHRSRAHPGLADRLNSTRTRESTGRSEENHPRTTLTSRRASPTTRTRPRRPHHRPSPRTAAPRRTRVNCHLAKEEEAAARRATARARASRRPTRRSGPRSRRRRATRTGRRAATVSAPRAGATPPRCAATTPATTAARALLKLLIAKPRRPARARAGSARRSV